MYLSLSLSLPPSLATSLSPYLPSYYFLRSTLLFLQFTSYSPPFLPFLEPHRLHSPFSFRPSLALPLYFTHISCSSPPLDVNPGDPLFVELLPLIRENLPKKLAEVAWDRVESKFPVQYQVGRAKKMFLTLTRRREWKGREGKEGSVEDIEDNDNIIQRLSTHSSCRICLRSSVLTSAPPSHLSLLSTSLHSLRSSSVSAMPLQALSPQSSSTRYCTHLTHLIAVVRSSYT